MDAIQRILASRRIEPPKVEGPVPEGPAVETPTVVQEVEERFFFSLSPGVQENFVELQFRDGLRAAFPYSALMWLNFSPSNSCLDLEFGSALVVIRGRGLYPKLFTRLKEKRVVWVKEADLEMEDNDKNDSFIEAIEILPAGKTEDA